jgi:hypothetical protein
MSVFRRTEQKKTKILMCVLTEVCDVCVLRVGGGVRFELFYWHIIWQTEKGKKKEQSHILSSRARVFFSANANQMVLVANLSC